MKESDISEGIGKFMSNTNCEELKIGIEQGKVTGW